tara:strand:+ start:4788 stop:4922 length:135 start_codon:yes stop_codon:yes gene_type:complete
MSKKLGDTKFREFSLFPDALGYDYGAMLRAQTLSVPRKGITGDY